MSLTGHLQLDRLKRRGRGASPPGGLPLPLLIAAVGALGVAGVALAVATLAQSPPGGNEPAGICVLLAAAILAERFPVPMLGVGSGGVSLAAVFIVSAGYLYGWAPAALVSCVTRGVFEVAQRRPFDRIVYNGATYALSGASAGLCGALPAHMPVVHRLILAAFAGTAAFYLVNVVLIATVIASASGKRIRSVLSDTVRSTASVFAIMFSVSLMLDVLWQRSPVLSGTLLGPLMAIALYQRSSNRERAAMELALTDPLTGLGNYRAFQARFETLLDDADNTGAPVSLCVFDLDDFKRINDSHGHPAGDRVLASVAETLRKDGDSFRLGGDEFALLLPGCGEREAVELGARVIRRIAESQGDRDVSTTVSAGVATYPERGVERSELVRAADRALYAAKASGRNAIRPFRPGAIEFSERRIADAADRRARLDAASCLARTIEVRDAYTSDHSDAVGDLAARLAFRLGLSAEEAELIRLAGRVHDLGKLAIAEDVLRKAGPLDSAERHAIETHSEVGYRMLSSLGVEPVALCVLHHHERWDGTGYPNGLREHEIPIGSRILAVADAYHAMTSQRVYRDRMESGDALAELKSCAGAQFDPRVVEALIGLLEPEHDRPAIALAVA